MPILLNTKPSDLARKIIDALYDDTKPDACSWGDEFPDAHKKLFAFFADDMKNTIERIIEEFI